MKWYSLALAAGVLLGSLSPAFAEGIPDTTSSESNSAPSVEDVSNTVSTESNTAPSAESAPIESTPSVENSPSNEPESGLGSETSTPNVEVPATDTPSADRTPENESTPIENSSPASESNQPTESTPTETTTPTDTTPIESTPTEINQPTPENSSTTEPISSGGTSGDSSNQTAPSQNIEGSGSFTPSESVIAYTVTPTAINFGKGNVHEWSDEQIITITNTGTTDVTPSFTFKGVGGDITKEDIYGGEEIPDLKTMQEKMAVLFDGEPFKVQERKMLSSIAPGQIQTHQLRVGAGNITEKTDFRVYFTLSF